ncbi:hypothetical protein [Paucibacter sp. Y2R2-4]|uniref:hypothetical protein n=1 Tax=Paucibacter sp. Y2R2-4 TaxID=2893553 RepID=UPI0021E50934|nr:hypothetical protein [Paucibacter sp. Y2R2-4]MCV2349307.1 hypothetical protein [Paucibacter sp. Y2R2-4]
MSTIQSERRYTSPRYTGSIKQRVRSQLNKPRRIPELVAALNLSAKAIGNTIYMLVRDGEVVNLGDRVGGHGRAGLFVNKKAVPEQQVQEAEAAAQRFDATALLQAWRH